MKVKKNIEMVYGTIAHLPGVFNNDLEKYFEETDLLALTQNEC